MATMASPTTSISLAPESQPETASSLAPPPCGPASIVRCMSIRPVPPLVPPKADRNKPGAIWSTSWGNPLMPESRPLSLDERGFRVRVMPSSAAAGMGDSPVAMSSREHRGSAGSPLRMCGKPVDRIGASSYEVPQKNNSLHQFSAKPQSDRVPRRGAATQSPAPTPSAGGPRR